MKVRIIYRCIEQPRFYHKSQSDFRDKDSSGAQYFTHNPTNQTITSTNNVTVIPTCSTALQKTQPKRMLRAASNEINHNNSANAKASRYRTTGIDKIRYLHSYRRFQTFNLRIEYTHERLFSIRKSPQYTEFLNRHRLMFNITPLFQIPKKYLLQYIYYKLKDFNRKNIGYPPNVKYQSKYCSAYLHFKNRNHDHRKNRRKYPIRKFDPTLGYPGEGPPTTIDKYNIVSLNIAGAGTQVTETKYKNLVTWMIEANIDVLCMQETRSFTNHRILDAIKNSSTEGFLVLEAPNTQRHTHGGAAIIYKKHVQLTLKGVDDETLWWDALTDIEKKSTLNLKSLEDGYM